MDSKYIYKIKPQKEKDCTEAYLDSKSCQKFAAYVQSRAFSPRIAFLYGTVTKANGVRVEAVYEPLQILDEFEEMALLEDPQEETVNQVAAALGLKKVGWMFSRPERESVEEPLSAHELLLAADQQLEACNGNMDKAGPFVTVMVHPHKGGNASFEAFHVSKQCMAMVMNGALEESEISPGKCRVSETFTAKVPTEAGHKDQKTISTNFFALTVPVKQHTCTFLDSTSFPVANRDGKGAVELASLGKYLAANSSKPHAQRLADFQVLLTVAPLFSPADLPNIARSILDPKVPLGEGYKLILDNMQEFAN